MTYGPIVFRMNLMIFLYNIKDALFDISNRRAVNYGYCHPSSFIAAIECLGKCRKRNKTLFLLSFTVATLSFFLIKPHNPKSHTTALVRPSKNLLAFIIQT